jgi:hypothetical protein
MKGIVCNIQKNGFIEIQTGTYISVVELLGGYDIEIGDEIKGNLESLGGEVLFNISQDEEMDVFIQDLK